MQFYWKRFRLKVNRLDCDVAESQKETPNPAYVRPGRKYQRHINGIEGFWSYAKERFRKYHGVSRQHFPLYLKEMEFRFNHRRDDLFELVGTQLVRVLFAYPIRYSL